MGVPTFDTPVALDRDTFMRRLISSLGHLNEGILGSDVAGAYVMNVGLSMGAAIEEEYKRFWGIDRAFTVDEYAHVIVDLKQKIHGNFSLVSGDEEKVVVRTTSCPFEEVVRQSPSLCFMTSSVFGGIAARNFGYAKVALQKRIALGDDGCYVTVHLRRTPEAEAAMGREYFPDVDRASPDIAEQLKLMDSVRRLRRQLSQASSQWEELVRGAADAIGVLSDESTIAFANTRWRELLGIEGEELVGRSLLSLAHPDDQAAMRQCLAAAQRGERLSGCAYRLQHRDGDWRDVLGSIGPVRDEGGQVLGTVAIMHDVTPTREAERLKEELLSTTSHELRTPVATIKALTGLLQRTLERGRSVDPAQLTKNLDAIQREADRLALLASDLIEVARHQSGQPTMRTRPQDLREIVTAAVEAQQARLGERARHEVTLRQPDGPVPVDGDATRLGQVLANLLENAVKYSPEGSTVIVATELADETARVRVTDRGIGIPAPDLPNLFTPFFRASNATARNYGGLGLGLHLSKLIAEAHGGDLVVESDEGRGTSFILSLPRLLSPSLGQA